MSGIGAAWDFFGAARAMAEAAEAEGHIIYTTRNNFLQTKLRIHVAESKPKLIGSKEVEFYKVTTKTDYDGFRQLATVERRYSEFQTLRRILVSKGGNPIRLSWTRKIPGFVSRWEELNDWVEHLGSLKFNEACLAELKRFLQNKSPYEAERMLTGIWFVDRLLDRSRT